MSLRLSLLLSALILLCGAFFLTRVNRVDESLLYFNDMGRDSLTLLDWQQTGKPPLLGPQTSALPFNQSAVYFYLLYPAFVLTHHSAFASIYTMLCFYIGIFVVLFWLVRKNLTLCGLLVCVLALITIHPQFIAQTRFVWNPTFVGPLILSSFVCFYQAIYQKKIAWEAATALCLALATSLNLSALPSVFAFAMVAVFIWKIKVIRFYLELALSFLIINLPTLIFELRHHFLLTRMLLTRPRLPQSGIGLQHETSDLINHTLVFPQPHSATLMAIALLLLFVCGWLWFRSRHSSGTQSEQAQAFFLAVSLFTLSTVITLAMPISIQAHYIFAVLTLGFITLCLLPVPLFLLGFFFLGSVWLPPLLSGSYYQPAIRTVQDMQSCYAQVCSQEKEPLFVSVQASFHPYHNGPEHRFLMREAGCTVIPIETQPAGAKTMAVVVDDSVYEHGKTSYNELSMFGPSTVQKEYLCSPKLQVYILQKK